MFQRFSPFIIFLFLLSGCNPDNKAGKENDIPSPLPEETRLKKAVASYPDSLLLKETLIQYYRDSGDYTNALATTREALKKDSSNARLWNIQATLYFENADTLQAIHSFEKALEISGDPEYINALGILYAQTKDKRALEMASQLMNPQINAIKEALYIKGLYYSFSNEKQKAITMFNQCLAMSYTFMDAYREKAIALYDLGKYEEALAVLDKALTLQNNYDEGYYYSGRCLEKLGRVNEAMQAYRNALVIDPGYLEAKNALLEVSRRTSSQPAIQNP